MPLSDVYTPPVSSGGSVPVAGLYDVAGSGVLGTYAAKHLTWSHNADEAVDPGLLDLTDPVNPVLTDGGYVIATLRGQFNGDTVEPWNIAIDLDTDNVDANARTVIPKPAAGGNVAGSVTISYKVPPGGKLDAYVRQKSGGALDFLGTVALIVIPLA